MPTAERPARFRVGRILPRGAPAQFDSSGGTESARVAPAAARCSRQLATGPECNGTSPPQLGDLEGARPWPRSGRGRRRRACRRIAPASAGAGVARPRLQSAQPLQRKKSDGARARAIRGA